MSSAPFLRPCRPPSKRKGQKMPIKVKYDNHNVTKAPIEVIIDISESDLEVMVEKDHQSRLAAAEDKSSVKRRTAQEIMDEEFNKPLYNDWHRHNNHRGTIQTPFRKDGDTEDIDPLDTVPDYSVEIERDRKAEYEATCQMIHNSVKPEYADVLIAIAIDGYTPEEYACMHKLSRDAVYKRYQRAREKMKKILS